MSDDIPVFLIEGKTLPEAWEKAVLKTWESGLAIKTEYDKPEDPPSRDCTMVLVVNEPLSEPRIHRAFPAGLEDLEIYRLEVVEGVHDHWIDPAAGKWTYTYHKRLFAYEADGKVIDQINYAVEKLSKTPFSRRAQAITWNPVLDAVTHDPPCLQRLWFRLVESHDGYILNMNTHWRSRDAYKAAFMNIFALTDLGNNIAGRISKNINKPVTLGRYVDISDSFHIYGAYHNDFAKFLDLIKKRTFAERTWDSKFAAPFFQEAKKRI